MRLELFCNGEKMNHYDFSDCGGLFFSVEIPIIIGSTITSNIGDEYTIETIEYVRDEYSLVRVHLKPTGNNLGKGLFQKNQGKCH